MLRVVVYINQTPLIDTHAVRTDPIPAYEDDICTYKTDDDVMLRERFDFKNGAIKLAIKLLRRKLEK